METIRNLCVLRNNTKRDTSRNDDSEVCTEVGQRNDAGARLSYRRLIEIFLLGRSIGTSSQRSDREIRFEDNAHLEIGPQSSGRLRLTDTYISAIFLKNARQRSIDRRVSPTPSLTKWKLEIKSHRKFGTISFE